MRPDAHTDMVRNLIARYAAGWDRALGGGPAPDLAAHLGEVPDADRAGGRSRLEGLDGESGGRVGSGPPPPDDRTMDQPPTVQRTMELADPAARAATDTHPDLDLTFDSSANTLDAPGGPTTGL